MLYTYKIDRGRPYLVFLHGFLGTGHDFYKCSYYLNDYSLLFIDLPYHGRSKDITVNNFDDVEKLINTTLKNILKPKDRFIFIGYSLGARIILYTLYKKRILEMRLKGVILEAGNIGLESECDKKKRFKNDLLWAKRFLKEDIKKTLCDWYKQDVFSNLEDKQINDLIKLRSKESGPALSKMLMATSLSCQPFLLDTIKSLKLPYRYICGDRDIKFKKMINKYSLNHSIIDNSGHNTHYENTLAFSKEITRVAKIFLG